MQMKKVLAVLMSFCMTAGVVSYGAPFSSQAITAHADVIEGSCYSFDETTGVLKLKGEVDGYTLHMTPFFRGDVKSIIAEEGTFFPIVCMDMFSGYDSCTSIDLSKADTSNVKDMTRMFNGCCSVTNMDLSSFDTSNVKGMSGMFGNCSALTTVDLSSFNTGKVTNMLQMFYNCPSLTTLDLSGFDTSNVTDMQSMFSLDSNLTSLDLSSFDTRNVKDMRSMFDHCKGLTSLDLSSFDTRNVSTMSYMFCHCESLNSLVVSNFITSNVTDMSLMFCYCKSLTSLYVSNFNTSNVTNMSSMFSGCSGLSSLKLGSFNTDKVTRMDSMFFNCPSLISLNISSFNTSNVITMWDMFANCNNLNVLAIGENFKSIKEEAKLPNGNGWVNTKSPEKVISGDGKFAVIENEGKNTYIIFGTATENKPTYPTNIKVEYNEKYHQVRFTWDKVEGADRYGIAVYLAGKWRVQTQTLTDTTYTSPKNLTPGRSYRVAIAARVNGKWDTKNAIKHSGTVTIR